MIALDKKISLCLILVLFACFGFSQKHTSSFRLDSLIQEMKRGTLSDSTHFFHIADEAIILSNQLEDYQSLATIYQNIGNFYSYFNNKEEAFDYFDQSSQAGLEVNDSSFLIINNIRKAFLIEEVSSFEAEDHFNEWLVYAEKHKIIESIIEAYNGLGILYENRRNLSKAFESYLNAFKIAEEHGLIRYQSIMLNNIGLMRLAQEQFDNAISDFEKGLKLAEQTDDERLMFNLKNNIGLILTEKQEHEKALAHYIETLRFAKAKNAFPMNLVVSYLNIASVHISLENFDLAEEYIDSGKFIIDKYSLVPFKPKATFLKGRLFQKQGDVNKAITYFEKGIEEAKEYTIFDSNVFDDVLNTMLNLSSIYESKGNYEKAYKQKNEYYAINDSIKGLMNEKKISDLEVAYYKEKMETSLLQEKNQRIELEIKTRQQQSEMIIVSVTSISLILFLALFFHARSQKNKRLQQQLFSQRIIDRVDKERVRIASDLHDDLGQSLSLIKSKINRFQKGVDLDFNELSEDISGVINQARGISHSLHPAHLEKIGFKKAIQSLLEKVEKSTHLITNFIIDDESVKLTKDTHLQLYRITQEAINNTIKHADAKSIRVKLKFDLNEKKWVYSYRDNGKGLSKSLEEGVGIGIQTINERVKKIDGKLKVLSSKDIGTTLIISFKG